MEDEALPYGVAMHASQHAHMHFKGSGAPPTSPPLPPHPQHDSLLSPSYTLDSQHPSQCGQDSCGSTDSMNAHDADNSPISTCDDMIPDIHRSCEGVELDLSLGNGHRHQEQLHGFQAHVIPSEAVEHNASRITDLEGITSGFAAAPELSPRASFLAFKSHEGTPWENTCSSIPNHRHASSTHCLHPNVGDCDGHSCLQKVHSVLQVRVDSELQAFPPFMRGALPGDGAFVASHEQKVFFCKFCDRRFHSSQALGGHQNAHKRERLVARSTSLRFGVPSFFCAAPGTSMHFQSPSWRVQQHLVGTSGDRPSLVVHPPPRPSMFVTTVCQDRFEAPSLVSSMRNSELELDCLPSKNVYAENRSLGIQAHSLVHKPSAGQFFGPRMGHVKAMNIMPSASDRPSFGWARASIDVQPGVARYFVPGQDHHVQHGYMHDDTRSLLCMKEGSSGLLHHHHHQQQQQQQQQCTDFNPSSAQPLVNHSLKACINSGFLHKCDSGSAVVDLALHL